MPTPEELVRQNIDAPLAECSWLALRKFDLRLSTFTFSDCLTSNHLDPVARVTISTIQRLYAMLRGEELNEDLDEKSGFEIASAVAHASSLSALSVSSGKTRDSKLEARATPLDVAYNPAIPIETFDIIIADECHRSIYNLWRQVLEYFDAFLIGAEARATKWALGSTSEKASLRCGDSLHIAGRN